MKFENVIEILIYNYGLFITKQIFEQLPVLAWLIASPTKVKLYFTNGKANQTEGP